MAIENSEAPRRKREQPGSWKKNSHQRNREFALGARKPRRDEIDQPRRHQHADQTQDRDRQCERRAHRAGHLARFFLAAFGQQTRVHRDERRRQYAFAEQVLQKIGMRNAALNASAESERNPK